MLKQNNALIYVSHFLPQISILIKLHKKPSKLPYLALYQDFLGKYYKKEL